MNSTPKQTIRRARRVWIKQNSRQKKELGAKAPWYVCWYHDGRQRSRKIGTKTDASQARRAMEGTMAAGYWSEPSDVPWSQFVKEHEEKILSRVKRTTAKEYRTALAHFTRIVKSHCVGEIGESVLDSYTASRSKERGHKRGSTVSPATINKELRSIKAALMVAKQWNYLPIMPKVRFLKEPSKLPRVASDEAFVAIYVACEGAKFPSTPHCSPCDWWRALLTFAYMTGWRLHEILALRRGDVDLEREVALTRHADNKGGRDELVSLDSMVIEHLRPILKLSPMVFPWPHGETTLYREYHRIQKAAGIHLDCHEDHEHTDACHYFGFHDLRRTFATNNASKLSAPELQQIMRHKSFSTTLGYVNVAASLQKSKPKLHRPELPKTVLNVV